MTFFGCSTSAFRQQMSKWPRWLIVSKKVGLTVSQQEFVKRS